MLPESSFASYTGLPSARKWRIFVGSAFKIGSHGSYMLISVVKGDYEDVEGPGNWISTDPLFFLINKGFIV